MSERLLINRHTHLEGRVRASTAAELAATAGLPDPVGGWAQALALEGPAELTAFLGKVAASFSFCRTGPAAPRRTGGASELTEIDSMVLTSGSAELRALPGQVHQTWARWPSRPLAPHHRRNLTHGGPGSREPSLWGPIPTSGDPLSGRG